jgi:hypothetical protein
MFHVEHRAVSAARPVAMGVVPLLLLLLFTPRKRTPRRSFGVCVCFDIGCGWLYRGHMVCLVFVYS